jgi:hypothetical protein
MPVSKDGFFPQGENQDSRIMHFFETSLISSLVASSFQPACSKYMKMLINLVITIQDIVLSEECLSQNLVWKPKYYMKCVVSETRTQLPEYTKLFGVWLSFMNKLQDAWLKNLSFDKVVKRQRSFSACVSRL